MDIDSIDFEWDEDKSTSNFSKHGIHFADAVGVFLDDCALIKEDRRWNYWEARFRIIGAISLGVLVVVYAEPGENLIRIISARKATRSERAEYRQGIELI